MAVAGTRLAKEERHRRIITELRTNPTVRISTLADEYSVSTETVRRDIDELSRKGLVNRTYGGAASTALGWEPAVNQRGGTMVPERDRIARHAVASIQAGDVLMVDGGSTTTRFARRLAIEGTPVTVITNSIGVVTALAACPDIRVIVCPGEFDGTEDAVYGPETGDFLGRFHANVAVLSAGGITPKGLTDVDSRASWVKRWMMQRAEQTIAMMDHSKFDLAQLEVVQPLDGLACLICDRKPIGALAKALKEAAVQVEVA